MTSVTFRGWSRDYHIANAEKYQQAIKSQLTTRKVKVGDELIYGDSVSNLTYELRGMKFKMPGNQNDVETAYKALRLQSTTRLRWQVDKWRISILSTGHGCHSLTLSAWASAMKPNTKQSLTSASNLGGDRYVTRSRPNGLCRRDTLALTWNEGEERFQY